MTNPGATETQPKGQTSPSPHLPKINPAAKVPDMANANNQLEKPRSSTASGGSHLSDGITQTDTHDKAPNDNPNK